LPRTSVPPKLAATLPTWVYITAMTLLLVLTSILLLASGLVKLHAGERAGLGITVPPLAETAAGFAVLVPMVLGWRPGARGGLAMVVCAVALVLASSLLVGAAVVRKRKSREDSEGARLVTYVRYLSRRDPPRT
jgi:hypothetical protein